MEAAKADLLQKIAKEKLDPEKPLITKETFFGWLQQFKELDITRKEDRQRLVDHFVNVIYLYDDHFDLFLNFRDGVDTVTFDEAQLAKAKARKRKNVPQSSDMENLSPPKNRLAFASLFFYPSRRLGISSRVSVYIIKVGKADLVSHYGVSRAYLSCGLMRYTTSS